MGKIRKRTRTKSPYRTLDDYGGDMYEFYEWCEKRGLNYRRSILLAIRLFKLFHHRRKGAPLSE